MDLAIIILISICVLYIISIILRIIQSLITTIVIPFMIIAVVSLSTLVFTQNTEGKDHSEKDFLPKTETPQEDSTWVENGHLIDVIQQKDKTIYIYEKHQMEVASNSPTLVSL